MHHILLMYRRPFDITLVQWSGDLKIHQAFVAGGATAMRLLTRWQFLRSTGDYRLWSCSGNLVPTQLGLQDTW